MLKVSVTDIEIINYNGDNIKKGLNPVVCYENGDKKKFWFTTDNGKLFYADFRDQGLYDESKGGLIKNNPSTALELKRRCILMSGL